MRQASNSPLTLDHFSTKKGPSVQALPRALGWTGGLLLTPFPFRRRAGWESSHGLLDLPYPPRSRFCSRLGEGSVRCLSAFALSVPLLFVILLSPRPARAQSVGTGSIALVHAIRSHVSELSGWEEEEIEVHSLANLNRVSLPSGDVSFHVSQKTPLASCRNLILPIEASLQGKAVGTFWIKADVTVLAKVLQAARRLPFGSTITPGDVTESLIEITDLRVQYFRRPEEAAGRVLRRTLATGEPITRECLAAPFIVRSGEIIKILFKHGAVSLAALARAEQNGKLGQVIRVRNLDFSRPVKAEVTGPGEVTIE